jgi:putative effector of murein hydrolase LrgA (UPF0299 family)
VTLAFLLHHVTWHVWIGVVLALVSVLMVLGLVVQYLVKVQAPQYPKRAKK